MKKIMPPIYLLSALMAMALLHFLLPGPRIILFPWRFCGVAPLALGITLNLAADSAFKRSKTTVKPFEKSSHLVTDGVFIVSRNPMYLGMVLCLLGIAILLGTTTPLFVVPIMAVLFDLAYIIPEEKMLKDTFGEKFERYRTRTRRWL